jgi:hypothetical protein
MPNHKSQTNSNAEIQNSKPCRFGRLSFRILNLFGIWRLGFGIYSSSCHFPPDFRGYVPPAAAAAEELVEMRLLFATTESLVEAAYAFRCGDPGLPPRAPGADCLQGFRHDPGPALRAAADVFEPALPDRKRLRLNRGVDHQLSYLVAYHDFTSALKELGAYPKNPVSRKKPGFLRGLYPGAHRGPGGQALIALSSE